MVDSNSFKFWHAKQPENSVPMWVILTPQEVAPIDGMNNATGMQDGFYGPMNQKIWKGGRGATSSHLSRRELSTLNFAQRILRQQEVGKMLMRRATPWKLP